MPAEYPQHPDEYDEEEDEEEEEEDEEVEEWSELVPLDDIDALEDGPSTFFVGGFSACQKLSEAIARAQYAQDRILIFPGAFTEAQTTNAGSGPRFPAGSADDVVIVNEARLKGLCIEGVPFSRAMEPFPTKVILAHNNRRGTSSQRAKAKALRVLLSQKEPTVGRRVGPWFTYAAAAAANSNNTNGGNSAATATASGGGAAGSFTMTTTMGSSIYGATVTPMVVDASRFPVFSSRLVLRTSAAAVAASDNENTSPASPVAPLKHYAQEPDENEDEDDEDEDGNGDDGGGDEEKENSSSSRNNNYQEDVDDEEDAGSAAGGGVGGKGVPSVTIQGLVFTGGAALEPLTDGLLRHCILGAPSILHTDPFTSAAVVRHGTTLTAHPLTDARVERCVVYGGEKHGVYAFPRSAVAFTSCLIDGPSRSASMLTQQTAQRPVRHAPSTLAMLEGKAAQRALAAAAEGGEDGGSGGSGDSEQQFSAMAAAFTTPAAGDTLCEVAVFCDDADASFTDCMITHARLGLLLHDRCSGTKLTACDVRCMEEVGVYCYGLAGCAVIRQCTARSCGRECLLVAGPAESQAAAAEAQYREEYGIPADTVKKSGSDDDDGEDGDEETDDEKGGRKRRPVFAQHPHIRQCVFTGAVRLQGLVGDGACIDNLVFAPRIDNSTTATSDNNSKKNGFNGTGTLGAAAAARANAAGGEVDAATASSLIQGPNFGVAKTFPQRGFAVAGRDGVPRKAADSADDI